MDPIAEHTRIIRASSYQRVRWKNGAGWTREILRSPDREEWDWRLSIAEIEHDAPFSSFAGVERELVLLAGNGLRLAFDDGSGQILSPPHERARFAGERALTGHLIDGPTQDFNLMWRRDRIDARLWHRPLVGPMVMFVEPGTAWAIHLIAGQARFADASRLTGLTAGDTAILAAETMRQRHVLEGGGEVLVIRVQRPSGT